MTVVLEPSPAVAPGEWNDEDCGMVLPFACDLPNTMAPDPTCDEPLVDLGDGIVRMLCEQGATFNGVFPTTGSKLYFLFLSGGASSFSIG